MTTMRERQAAERERREAAAFTLAKLGVPPPSGGLAHIWCAAIVNGCRSFIVLPLRAPVPDGAPAAVNRDSAALELLRLNGWHVDHGRWVCGQHERGPCTCHPESAAGRSGGTCSGEAWCEHCA